MESRLYGLTTKHLRALALKNGKQHLFNSEKKSWQSLGAGIFKQASRIIDTKYRKHFS